MADESLYLVPSQQGTAIIDLIDGKVIKATGDILGTDEGKCVCSTIYKMLLDTAKCLGNEPLRRISVTFSDHSFVATLNEKYIYLVKTNQS